MTLLLDAEARLFSLPEPEEAPRARRFAPSAAPAEVPARERAAAAPAAAPVSAPADRAPTAPADRAPIDTPADRAPIEVLPAPADRAPVEALPAPATWAGAAEHAHTLDDVLSVAWEGLSAAASATACPVCDGELAPRWSAGAGVVGGRCRDCGSELS